MEIPERHYEYFSQLVAIALLVAGCLLVLLPFFAATLFAAVVCISTWPFYLGLLRRMNGWRNLAAFTMTLSLVIVVILPLANVAYHLADGVTSLYDGIKQVIDAGPIAPPAWLKGLPLVGESADAYWHLLATNHEELVALEKRLLEPTKSFLLAGGLLLGHGVLEMSLAAVVCFFLYRDGVALMRFIRMVMERMLGSYAEKVIVIIDGTVQRVMYGLLGSALAQGAVATFGFFIAGVPAPMLLGLTTFLLSLIPIGPPLIWGGAAVWLFYQGYVGWGIFMLLWGVFLISGVDNVVKPMLISRGSNMPFIVVLFGVVGGVLAFGFVGLFIGPALLAVGLNLIEAWVVTEPMP